MGRLKDDYALIRKGFGHAEACRLELFPRLLSRLPWNKHANLYEKAIYTFLNRHFGDLIAKYQKEPVVIERKPIVGPIWTMWWQGEAQMPPVIRECYDSILRNANGREVILLTKDNFADYIQLPDYVLRKVEEGKITLTHLSDHIRATVLAEKGGLYMDCALFVTKPIELGEVPFFSTRIEGNPERVANRHKWVFGLIGSNKGDVVARFMQELFFDYWKKFDIQITYLMMDFMLLNAYNQIPAIKAEIDLIPCHSPNLHESRYLFNQKIDEERFENYINNNTFFSLTYRFEYPMQIDGVDTYYGRMIKVCKK
jgi:hypothetical protein